MVSKYRSNTRALAFRPTFSIKVAVRSVERSSYLDSSKCVPGNSGQSVGFTGKLHAYGKRNSRSLFADDREFTDWSGDPSLGLFEYRDWNI